MGVSVVTTGMLLLLLGDGMLMNGNGLWTDDAIWMLCTICLKSNDARNVLLTFNGLRLPARNKDPNYHINPVINPPP